MSRLGRFGNASRAWLRAPRVFYVMAALLAVGMLAEPLMTSKSDRATHEALLSYAEDRLLIDARACSAAMQPLTSCLTSLRPARADRIVGRFRFDLGGREREAAVVSMLDRLDYLESRMIRHVQQRLVSEKGKQI